MRLANNGKLEHAQQRLQCPGCLVNEPVNKRSFDSQIDGAMQESRLQEEEERA